MKRLSIRIKKRLLGLKRSKHNQFVHKIHDTHKISHKTIFYMKEYGKNSHVAHRILKESLPALIIALALGILSGVGLHAIKSNFIMLTPLIILLPALNDMIGDYSMILVSRLSTTAFKKGLSRKWWTYDETVRLVKTIVFVATLSAIYIGILSSVIASRRGDLITFSLVSKVLEVSVLTTAFMIAAVVTTSSFLVFYIYSKKEDPNNLVIPVMTALADLGTIIIFSIIVSIVF